MSYIRLKKTGTPSTPPSGRSKVYIDEADDHLKRRKDDGSVVDYDDSVTPEEIQDAIGSALTDTATIDLNYDDTANEITANIVQESINDYHVLQISPTKLGNNNYSRHEATINTTNSSFATAFMFDASNDGTYLVECRTNCRRTGGTSGNAGDGASFIRTFRVKSIGGVVTVHDLQSDFTSRDSNQMRVEYLVNLTDIQFRVGGVNNNNLTWVLDISINKNN
jgi:hypothetical protein